MTHDEAVLGVIEAARDVLVVTDGSVTVYADDDEMVALRQAMMEYDNLTEPPQHLIEFTETGYGLQHPYKCREGQSLLDCKYHTYLEQFSGPPAGPGRYVMEESALGQFDFVEMTA